MEYSELFDGGRGAGAALGRPARQSARHYIAPERLLLRTAIGCLLCLCSTVLAAQPAAPYGERYVRSGASWPGEAPRQLPPLQPLSEAELQALEARADALELADGPFSAGLSEVLADLARGLEAAGRANEADATRERALHLARINEGLYSPLQLPLLRSQLQSDRRRGDFEALDARYDYYWRLLGAGRPPFTELRYGAALEYQRWQREALRRNLDNGVSSRMLHLLRLGDDLIDALGQSPEPDTLQLRDAALEQLRNYYLFATLVQPKKDSFPPSARFRQPRFLDEDFDNWNPEREQLEIRRRGLKQRGEALLVTLIESTTDPRERGRLLLALGDWLQWWDDPGDALTAYRRSWQALEASGERALAEQWFAQPRPLPDSGVFLAPEEPLISGVPMRVEIDELGRARGELLVEKDLLPRDARDLPRLVRGTRFRPALRDADPVPMTLNEIRFDVFD